jgi:hypothetical protein
MPRLLYPQKEPLLHIGGCMGPTAGLALWRSEVSLTPVENQTPTVQPIARRDAHWTIPAPRYMKRQEFFSSLLHFFVNDIIKLKSLVSSLEACHWQAKLKSSNFWYILHREYINKFATLSKSWRAWSHWNVLYKFHTLWCASVHSSPLVSVYIVLDDINQSESTWNTRSEVICLQWRLGSDPTGWLMACLTTLCQVHSL